MPGPDSSVVSKIDGLEPENIKKNRDVAIVPSESHACFLMCFNNSDVSVSFLKYDAFVWHL